MLYAIAMGQIINITAAGHAHCKRLNIGGWFEHATFDTF